MAKLDKKAKKAPKALKETEVNVKIINKAANRQKRKEKKLRAIAKKVKFSEGETKKAASRDESMQEDEMSFDEDSIKKRISKMLESYKQSGGILELTTENGNDDAVGSDESANDSDVSPSQNDEDQETPKKPETKRQRRKNKKIVESGEGGEKTEEEKKKFDFERNSRTIFVGNLPDNMEHRDVAKLFKCCGPVESARIRSIVPEKEKLAPKVAMITKRTHAKVNAVNAYVVFKTNENDECVKKALEMNGRVIDGHHIRVDRASAPKAKKETLTSRKKSIFVGNLRFDLRDDDLINHFEKKVGPVKSVRLIRDRATGLGKGFGFVVFNDRASVKKALELDDTQFKGRKMRIKKVDDVKKADEANEKKEGGSKKEIKT